MRVSEQLTPPCTPGLYLGKEFLPRSSLAASQDPICTTARNRLCKIRSNIINSTLTQVERQVGIGKVGSYKVSQNANCEKRRERFAELPLFIQMLGKKS